MPQPLTTTERAVYEFLLDFLSEHSYQPSVREIGKQFGIKSTKTVSQILHAIAHKGYVELDPARSRGVKLLGFAAARRVQPVPCYERLARDAPVLRKEHRTRYITLDRCFLPAADAFFVRAPDDALAARGVLRGDYVLVRPETAPEKLADGTLVVAREGERAVLRLLGAQPRGDGSVVGAVCGILRMPETNDR